VEGDVPFYRELGLGLVGQDVRQLQAALVALGYLRIEPDGRFEASTAAGVREWRRELGLAEDDRVALGELIAVADLPRIVTVGVEIEVGRLASVGSEALFVLSEEPTFELPLTEAQAQAIDPAATLVVVHEGLEWPAVITATRDEADRGQVILQLAGSDGGPVCGEACDTLPTAGRSQLRGRIVSVPPTSGPAVPVSALQTDADGTAWVRLETGGRREVEVLASAGGLAVVDGIEIGERLRVGDPPSGGEDD
jgi:peptidoglycan hydrolase-like protein with peptidoglycan-binding domain